MAAALAAGCGGSSAKRPTGSGGQGGEETGGSSGSTGGKSGGSGGSAGGFGGAGGGASGGSTGTGGGFGYADAGPAPPATDGSAGSPDAAADAAAGDAATGPMAPPDAAPTCDVTIRAIRPMSFEDLPAGPTSRLRVQAEATGTLAPKMPAWEWTVEHLASGQKVGTTVVEMDRSTVEFKLATPGNYRITAHATANCFNSAVASATDHPLAHLWLRVLPRTNLAQPVEGFPVDVPTGGAPNQNVTLRLGTTVSIDPQLATHQAVYSYVRITAPGSTVRVEGHTSTGALIAHLDPDPARTYNVLVVPEIVPNMEEMAPFLVQGRASDIATNPFTVDPGVTVGGHLGSSKGPAMGARVLLRDGLVPSTTGEAKSTGEYTLHARSGGRFAAVVIPPAKSGLPEAHLAAGSGLAIYDNPPGPKVLDFTWDAIDTSTLELTVLDSAGGTLRSPVRVRLTSDDDAFPAVGTMTLKVVSPTAPEERYTYRPSGFVQQDGLVDARGFISFSDLPRGKYTAMLTPLDGSGAITTVPVDLSGSGRVSLSPRLASKVSVSGKLLPANITAGATLLALDAQADPATPPPSAIVDANGGYLLHLDPGRSYDFVLEAAPASNLPRTFLGSVPTGPKDDVRGDLTVGSGVPVTGRITGVVGATAGALVQAYCVGVPPACIDTTAPDITNVRPIAEAISDDAGNYRLLVPDPAIAN